MIRELKLADFGLMTTAEACAANGWAVRSIQNWIRAGLLPAVVVGEGRGANFLVRAVDVASFRKPTRGRPRMTGTGKPKPVRPRRKK